MESCDEKMLKFAGNQEPNDFITLVCWRRGFMFLRQQQYLLKLLKSLLSYDFNSNGKLPEEP